MSVAEWILDSFGPQVAWITGRVRNRSRFDGPESDGVEKTRGRVLRLLDPVARRLGRPFTRTKGTRDYICTVSIGVEELETVLDSTYQRNLLATKKCRSVDGRKQWAVGSWVHTETYTEPLQHHLYLFPGPDGGVDIYGHREADVSRPDEHHEGSQNHGDPDDILRETLENVAVDYRQRDV